MGTPAEMDINGKPYKQLTMPNGLKVAIVSVLDLNPNMKPACHPAHVEQVTFTDPIATAHQYLYLKEQNDLPYLPHPTSVLITTYVWPSPKREWTLSSVGTHTPKVDTEQIHNGILITQAEAKLANATLIKLTLHPDGTSSVSGSYEVGNKGNAKPEIAAMVAEYNNNPYMNEVLAHNPYPLTSAEQVGYWMADALQATAGTDLASLTLEAYASHTCQYVRYT